VVVVVVVDMNVLAGVDTTVVASTLHLMRVATGANADELLLQVTVKSVTSETGSARVPYPPLPVLPTHWREKADSLATRAARVSTNNLQLGVKVEQKEIPGDHAASSNRATSHQSTDSLLPLSSITSGGPRCGQTPLLLPLQQLLTTALLPPRHLHPLLQLHARN
jgi:hypothetical protein